MSDLLTLLQALHRQQHWWSAGAPLIVAVSGGPDSLCLLHLLHRLAAQQQLRLHVAHLDHGLRPESAADAAFVAATAAAWGWPVTVERREIAAQARGLGIEAAARAARYHFLGEVAIAHGAQAIVLGHTADDQAETVVLRLLRGAGPTGLAAMRDQRRLANGVPLVRPLLTVRRAAIERYCHDHNLQPRHDPSNNQPQFVRNRVRTELLPLLATYNPAIVRALNRTAQLCAEEDAYLVQQLDQAWPALASVQADAVGLDRLRLLELHPALQRRALRRASALLGDLTEVGADHLDRMLAVVQAGRGRLQLPGQRWIQVKQRIALLYTKNDQI